MTGSQARMPSIIGSQSIGSIAREKKGKTPKKHSGPVSFAYLERLMENTCKNREHLPNISRSPEEHLSPATALLIDGNDYDNDDGDAILSVDQSDPQLFSSSTQGYSSSVTSLSLEILPNSECHFIGD